MYGKMVSPFFHQFQPIYIQFVCNSIEIEFHPNTILKALWAFRMKLILGCTALGCHLKGPKGLLEVKWVISFHFTHNHPTLIGRTAY